MSYPTISYKEALPWWHSWNATGEIGTPPASVERGFGSPRDWREEALALVDELCGLLAQSAEDGGRDRFARFEADAAVRIHQTLPRDHAALADPEFWIWYAIDPGLRLVQARYQKNAIPNVANFASPNARESLFYRLWLRGEMGYRSGWLDPYFLSRHGDVDFWRSHIFRQRYAEYPDVLEAFVKFQYPMGPEGSPRIELSDNQRKLRTFVKRLKRIGTNVMVEFLDVGRSLQLMEGELNSLDATT